MSGDIDFDGVFVASLLVWMLVAFILNALLRRGLAWTGFYRFIWHRALFDFSVFVILLGGIVALASDWITL
jgi:hypothetical protein